MGGEGHPRVAASVPHVGGFFFFQQRAMKERYLLGMMRYSVVSEKIGMCYIS